MDPQIKFVQNAYLEAFKAAQGFATEQDILMDVRQTFLFHYGNVSKEGFNQKYSSSGWMTRKVFALPAALWTGVVQTIYHLAHAIFLGIPKFIMTFGDQTYFKHHLFIAARDLQEGYGRICSLFNDRYGSFHIQESRFQKTCYAYALMPTQVKNDSSGTVIFGNRNGYHSGYGGLIDSAADKITLLDYRNKTEMERADLLRGFHVYEISTNLGDLKVNLETFVQEANPQMLKVLTFKDLTIPFHASKMKFAIMSDADFHAITLRYLETCASINKEGKEITGVNTEQLHFIQQRLWKFSSPQPLLNGPLALLPETRDWSLRQLASTSSSAIVAHLETFPHLAFSLLSNHQLAELKISSLQSPQITALFRGLKLSEAHIRFALFEDQDVADAVSQGIFEGSCFFWPEYEPEVEQDFKTTLSNTLELVTEKQLEKIPLSLLSYDQIYQLFSHPYQKRERDRMRFAAIPAHEIQKALEKSLLDEDLANLISPSQLQAIDFSALSQKAINQLFPDFSTEEIKEKNSYWGTRLDLRRNINQRGWICDYKPEKLAEMSRKQKAQNETRLTLLTKTQRTILEPRLYQKDPLAKSYKEARRPTDDDNQWFNDIFSRMFADVKVGPASFKKSKKKPAISPEALAAYECLGLDTSVSLDDIKKAYKALALEHHPDKVVQQPGEDAATFEKRKQTSTEKFTAFTNAFKLLIEDV